MGSGSFRGCEPHRKVQKNTVFTWFDKLTTGFDKLRANGAGIERTGEFPFVLSQSKHERDFFSSLHAVLVSTDR
jgi:hypothetical protein